ncbi:MAG: hypothetical protein QXR42_09480 [Candidatus Bathyarchaeia archaeon]
MAKNISRKKLRGKFVDAFREEIRTLSTDLQQILADDLVTAFQNRLTVLARIQAKRSR